MKTFLAMWTKIGAQSSETEKNCEKIKDLLTQPFLLFEKNSFSVVFYTQLFVSVLKHPKSNNEEWDMLASPQLDD